LTTQTSQGNKWGYSVNDEKWAALQAAGDQANSANPGVVTMLEIATFEVLAGNVFLS